MSALEATVEIVKASLITGGASTASIFTLITEPTMRKNFLQGIEELYKKLQALESA
ncbi:MAG: hypothetical protein ABSF91_14075 [Bacteroidota bacterium]|jgi:hypothetical protein